MAWTAMVVTDKDKGNVGLVSATWNSEDPEAPNTFIYSRRAELTAAEKTIFVAEAKAALAERDAKAAIDANLQSILETALNA